ncbi:hypothetical protein ACLB1O_23200 [Escherichia coli]
MLHPETEAALTRLAWPGNVRQLENTCRWLTVMAAGQEVLIQDLPGELFESTVAESTHNATGQLGDTFSAVGRQSAAFRSSKSAFRSAARAGADITDDRVATYAGA